MTVKGHELGGSDEIPLSMETMLAKMSVFPKSRGQSS
jgi:hypothetical protein